MGKLKVAPSKIYVDPGREEHTVWTSSNEVFSIKDACPREIAERIRNLTSYIFIDDSENTKKLVQHTKIAVDKFGLGSAIIHILEEFGLKVEPINTGSWLLKLTERQEEIHKDDDYDLESLF